MLQRARKRQGQHISRDAIFDNMANDAAAPIADLCFLLLLPEIIFKRLITKDQLGKFPRQITLCASDFTVQSVLLQSSPLFNGSAERTCIGVLTAANQKPAYTST